MNAHLKTPVQQNTVYLRRPEGRIGYDVAGEGPLVVLVPGMGDLRGAYRFLAPALRDAGYRVACADLRGHGDSDTAFDSYGDVPSSEDVIALIEELDGGPAVVVGNSMGAACAALAAAMRPELVRAVVLIGPFLRNPKVNVAKRLIMRVATARPWVATVWSSYLPKLYVGTRPVDYEEYSRQVVASLRRPGYAGALSRTLSISHDPVEARLAEVSAPALVVMGERDPDFPDPRAEADWIARSIDAEVVMVPETGHYPQSQRPDLTAEAILRFLDKVSELA
jgi:pimeloyl-ACP methyl ester carboxylesterase